MADKYPGQTPDERNPHSNDGGISPLTFSPLPAGLKSRPQGDAGYTPIGPGSATWEGSRARALTKKGVLVGEMAGKGSKGRR
jgi:hypothetical protein